MDTRPSEATPSLDAHGVRTSYGTITQTGNDDVTPRAAAWGWARVASIACTAAVLAACVHTFTTFTAGGAHARGGLRWSSAANAAAAAGWPSGASGVLYAMPNTEGLGRQVGALSCYVAVAKARNLELVVVPFASGHDYGSTNNSWMRGDYGRTNNAWRRGTTGVVAQENVVYLDRYLNPTGQWRMLRDSDDTRVMDDPAERCEFATAELDIHTFVTRRADGNFAMFESNAHDLAATAASIWSVPLVVERLARLRGGHPFACLAMIQRRECNMAHVFPFSDSVQQRTRAALETIYGDPAPAFRALHLRRGDRCSNPSELAASPRCGDMSQMAFLSTCHGDPGAAADRPQDRLPLYVLTDETDPGQLQVLRQAGCKLAADFGGDAMDPATLFMVEANLHVLATDALSFGCSTMANFVSARRTEAMSPLKVYDAVSAGWVPASGAEIDTQIATQCGTVGRADAE